MKKRKALEADASDLQARYEEAFHRQNQLQQSLSELKQQNLNLTDSKFSLEEKVEELEYRNRHASTDIASLKSTIELLSREKEDLISKVKELSQNLTHESQLTLEKLALIKREENKKLEQEAAAKLKLQSELNQAQHQISLLTKDNAELEGKVRGIREENARVERKAFEYQNIIHEFETERIKLEATCTDLQKKAEKQKQAHKEEMYKLGKLLSLKISHLKAELVNYKKAITLDVQSHKRSATELVLDSVKFFRERLRNQADSIRNENRKEIDTLNKLHAQKVKEIDANYEQQHRLSREQFEKAVKNHLLEKEQAMAKNNELHGENTRLVASLETAKDEITRNRAQLERARVDNETLKNYIDEKSKEFSDLQIFVDKEVRRIKQEAEDLMSAAMNQLQDKHKRELTLLNESLEELKETNAARLKRILDVEVTKLQNCFIEDLESTKQSYELKLENYGKQLSELENNCTTLKQVKLAGESEIQKLNTKIGELEEEKNSILSQFDEQIEQFKEIIRQDNERYLEFKTETAAEIERYKKENKELRKDLQARAQQVEELNRITLEQEIQVQRFRNSLESEIRFHAEKQKETVKIGRSKDREIEDLQALLARSIKNLNNSKIEQASMHSEKLDYERPERVSKGFRSLRGNVNVIDDDD